MKKRIIQSFVIMLLLGVCSVMQAQESVWTLEKCIQYAIENNIQIKQQNLNTSYLENQLSQAKYNHLPQVGAYINENNSYGRSQVINGTYTNVNTSYANGGVSLSVPLFQGLARYNTMKQREIQLLSGQEEEKILEDQIALQVVNAYLQYLLNKEIMQISLDQLDLTIKQKNDMEKRVEAGDLPQNRLTEIVAQKAQDELQFVDATNNLALSHLQLAQLMNLEDYSKLKISPPEIKMLEANISNQSEDEFYKKSVVVMPGIKKATYNFESSKKGVSIAKAYQFPSLSFNSSYGSSWYTGVGQNFGSQMKNNSTAAFGFNLNIPIYSNSSNRINIKNAQITMDNANYALDLEKQQLRKQIEEAYIQSLSAWKRFQASEKSVDATNLAFENKKLEFELGSCTFVSYSEARNNMTRQQSELIQSKYSFWFKSIVLKYYETGSFLH